MPSQSVPNGDIGAEINKGNSMPLTEYAATPLGTDFVEEPTNYGVPQNYLLSSGLPDYPKLISHSRVYKILTRTPLTYATNLSQRLDRKVLLKREDLQSVFSFKIRGAYNKMAHLSSEQRWKGVVACSAGNHAQGVAQAARELKIPATIVMPSGTPEIKHRNVSRLGGQVRLHGEDFDAAKLEAQELEKAFGLTNIPPFDDPYVIAGQGTIGREILEQTDDQDLEAVFCCVGGGGLIAGIGAYIKWVAPNVKIIGVETYDANAMVSSLRQKRRVTLKEVGLFADGAAVKTVGKETFRLCSEVVDEIIEVTTDETCAAIKDVFEDTRSVLEPAGALALAGLKKYAAREDSKLGDYEWPEKRGLVAIASGANMNFDRLRFVADRAAIGENKEVLLGVTIPERPGAFIELIKAVLPRPVTEFSYRFTKGRPASILMGIQVTSDERTEQVLELMSRLHNSGMTATDLTSDELVKTHIRFLAGGRSAVTDEILYMFEFPERPGALIKFLMTLRPDQNISLFHYRNQGGDIGKVLAGIQCPQGDKAVLEGFLDQLGYPYSDCSDSPSYSMFLRDYVDS